MTIGSQSGMKFETVEMEYVGDRNNTDTLLCEFNFRGEKYLVPYKLIRSIAVLYGIPDAVRENVFNWADMMHNPD